MVAILLISVVIIVAVVGWWMSLTTSPTTPAVESADTASAPTDPPGTGSMWIISPNATGTVPAVPDLIWPEGAATSWLAAWCPFDPTANPDTVEQRIREAMTPAGWEQFSATPGQLMTEGAPGMTASCDEPVARVVSRPPGDATVVVVLVSATRTITDANGTRQFRIERRQFVVRGRGRAVAGRHRGGRWLMVLSLAGRGLLARKSGVKAVLLLGGSGTGLLVAGIVLILVLAIGLGDGAQTPTTTPGDGGCPIGAACTGEVFDPGNIISDNEFYNSTAMTETQIRDFIQLRGAACTNPNCLRAVRVTMADQPADAYCTALAGGAGLDAAAVIARVAVACGVNPRVMLVTLQKESGLVTRTDPTPGTYAAAWGWHCPDTGPGGTANCDPAYAGLANQAYGMAKQWSRYRVDPGKYTYQAGETAQILFNVAESGCGAAPVTITNQATAGLYNYTPYQPNQASLAAYPGTGDQCSSYGNRNFFYLYQSYFGSTGGGTPATTATRRRHPGRRHRHHH